MAFTCVTIKLSVKLLYKLFFDLVSAVLTFGKFVNSTNPFKTGPN